MCGSVRMCRLGWGYKVLSSVHIHTVRAHGKTGHVPDPGKDSLHMLRGKRRGDCLAQRRVTGQVRVMRRVEQKWGLTRGRSLYTHTHTHTHTHTLRLVNVAGR